MKKLSLLLSALLLIGFTAVQAQTTVSEGMLKMEITKVDSSDPATAQQLAMMEGSTMIAHFNKSLTLMDVNMMGGMIQMKSLANKKDKTVTMYMDMMGQKKKVSTTQSEMKGGDEAAANPFADAKITYDEKETKEILGYKCIKAILTPTEGSEMPFTIEAYIAEDLVSDISLIQGADENPFKGLPLEYSMKIDSEGMNMIMTYSAVEFKKKVDEASFKIDGEGYDAMTWKEFQGMTGGGGFGF